MDLALKLRDARLALPVGDDRSGCDRYGVLIIVLHGHGDDAITEQSRAADREDASLGDLDILVDFQEDRDTAHVGKNLRRLGHLTDSGPREQKE